MKNILITGAQTQESYIASRILTEKCDATVFMEGMGDSNIGFYSPYVKEKLLKPANYTYLKEKQITHILPFHDFNYWSLKVEEIKDLGIKIITNSFESLRKIGDYFELYKECRKNGIVHPKIYRNNNEIDAFPLIIKSRDKKESYMAKNMRDVYNFTAGRRDILVQQYIPGPTIKVDFVGENWLQQRFCLFDYVIDIVKYEFLEEICKDIISSFGLKFGTISFVMSDTYYFINIKPYIEWEAMLLNESILLGLLALVDGEDYQIAETKENLRLIKVPSIIIKEGEE